MGRKEITNDKDSEMNKRNRRKNLAIYCADKGLKIIYTFQLCSGLYDKSPYKGKKEVRNKTKSICRKFVKSKSCKRTYKMIMNSLTLP
jgi:hypothetical protein